MNKLIDNLFVSSGLTSWLEKHGLGWVAGEKILDSLGIIIGSIIVYYVGRWLITKILRQAIRGTGKQHSWHKKDTEKREKTLISLGSSFWHVLIIAYAVIMLAHTIFGLDLSPLFASAGIIGVAIGFGSQSLIKDFLSGLFIIAENQYRVGDIVEIAGSSGKIVKVGTRSTVLRDIDGNAHFIPNGTIQRVINKTMGYGMSRFTISLPQDTDVDKATKIINQIGKELAKDDAWAKKIIDPPAFEGIEGISEKSVNVTVSGKTMPADQWSVASEMKSRLRVAFEEQDITMLTINPSK